MDRKPLDTPQQINQSIHYIIIMNIFMNTDLEIDVLIMTNNNSINMNFIIIFHFYVVSVLNYDEKVICYIYIYMT